jgi:threonine-phosphate decarboxylase
MSEKVKHKHGGDIYEVSKDYGINRQSILDFSANINPLGLPDTILKVIENGIKDIVNYPDPECRELRTAISGYLNVPEEGIVVGNGASEVIFLLFEVLKPNKVLIPAPSFAEYERAAEKTGSKVEFFRLLEEQDFKLQVDSLAEAMDRDVDLVILCNPNNPTSTLTGRDELLKLIEKARNKGVNIVIDEAFIELTAGGNGNSMAEYLKHYENMFIVRAFTKLFAVPGLRLGYGAGSSDIVKKMWREKQPWSVNSFACCTGRLLTDEKDYMKKTHKWLKEEKSRFYNELCKFSCLKAFEPQTNFILLKLVNTELDAAALKEKMIRKGILIRDASNFKFLGREFFRVAIKDRESNNKFIEALSEILGGF